MLNKANGRVQIVNGEMIYSPNSSRDITSIPPPDADKKYGVTANIFKPLRTMNLANYQSARWWNHPFGYVAFVPCRPEFTGPILGKLQFLPRRRQDLEFDEVKGYSMPQAIMQNWYRVECDIIRAVDLLSRHTKIFPLTPIYPSKSGYMYHHKSWRTALRAIERSRDWFVIWVGALSYLIAVAESETEKRKEFTYIALADWYSHLIKTGCQESWLEALTMSSMVRDFSTWTDRAGTFVAVPSEDSRLPKVEWLCQFCIPVWYRWKPEWASEWRRKDYAPLPHQLQAAMSGIPPQVADNDPLLPSTLSLAVVTSIPRKHITWQEFFAQREEINKKTELMEDKKAHDARISRTLQPPYSSGKVFEWIDDGNGVLTRTPVPKAANEDTFSQYERGQIRYDAFWNEFDCCEEFEGNGIAGLGFDDEDEDEDGSDNGSDNGEDWYADGVQNDSDSQNSFDDHDQEPAHDLPVPHVHWEHHDEASVDNHLVQDRRELDTAIARAPPIVDDVFIRNFELDILETCRLRFGYTGALPIPSFSEITDVKVQMNFLKFLGIKRRPLEAQTAVFKLDPIIAAYNFTQRLASQIDTKIFKDEWDLSPDHRETLTLNPRLSCIRKLEVSVGTTRTMWYMFDFGSRRTANWMFTVTSPANALLVCRLGDKYNENDLALYFLKMGIPFRTMQLSTTLTRAPYSASSQATIVNRSAGYTFSIQDFTSYTTRRFDFLKNNRRSRVALMRGGVLWRLAVEDVTWSTVLNGPSGWSPNRAEYTLGRDIQSGLEYMDDELTEAEVEQLCGVYHCLTGNGDQIAKRSWFPHPGTYEGSAYDYGSWTEFCEWWYGGVQRKAKDADSYHQVQSKTDDPAQRPLPFAKKHWASRLKGLTDMQFAISRLNKVAEEILNSL